MPEKTIEIKYLPHFAECFTHQGRYLVMYGGSGSGKSYTAALKIIQRCISEQGHRYLVVRKVAKTLKESVYKIIHDILSDSGLIEHCTVNKSDHSFTFSNGSQIITSGLDDVEKLKSIQRITSIWIEEATELEQGDLDQLDLRLRGETKYYKQIMLTFNPIDETHWLKAVFFDSVPEGCLTHWSNYTKNPLLDSQYIEVLNNRIAADDNLKRVYLEGRWGRIKTGGEFITQFKYSLHVVDNIEYNPELPLQLSYDQNVVPYLSAIAFQVVKEGEVYTFNFIDEWANVNPVNNTETLCRHQLERYEGKGITGVYYYGDATGKKRDTRGRENDYDIIERVWRKYITHHSKRVPGGNPSVNKTRVFLNKLFAESVYPVKIRISSRCKHLIADIENIKEDIDGGMLKEKFKDKTTGQSYEKYGHHLDCMRYALCEALKGYFQNLNHYI